MIGLAGKQRAGFLLADIIFGGSELSIEIFQKLLALLGVAFFLGEADVGFDVIRKTSELIVGADLLFRALAVAQHRLRSFLIVPELGPGDAGFERFQKLTMLRSVKENSGPARREA
jgi:hypothetical protein